MYELFEHTADLGLRVRAPDLATLFREGAEGLFSMMVEENPKIAYATRRELSIEGERYDHLLLDWLSELLFIFETEHLVLGEFEVTVDGHRLEAGMRARPLDVDRDQLGHEVKAITYHGLRVEQAAGGWLAELIVDI